MRAFGFEHRSGLGVVAGPVSGCVECWDFDDVETYDAFIEAAVGCGLGGVVSRIREGFAHETPRSGRRWAVRYPKSVTWKDCTLARLRKES